MGLDKDEMTWLYDPALRGVIGNAVESSGPVKKARKKLNIKKILSDTLWSAKTRLGSIFKVGAKTGWFMTRLATTLAAAALITLTATTIAASIIGIGAASGLVGLAVGIPLSYKLGRKILKKKRRQPPDKAKIFHKLVRDGNVIGIEEFLKVNGPSIVNQRNPLIKQQTPLIALMTSHLSADKQKKIAEVLLKNGANINARDNENHTVLYYALINRATVDLPMVDFLKRSGAILATGIDNNDSAAVKGYLDQERAIAQESYIANNLSHSQNRQRADAVIQSRQAQAKPQSLQRSVAGTFNKEASAEEALRERKIAYDRKRAAFKNQGMGHLVPVAKYSDKDPHVQSFMRL